MRTHMIFILVPIPVPLLQPHPLLRSIEGIIRIPPFRWIACTVCFPTTGVWMKYQAVPQPKVMFGAFAQPSLLFLVLRAMAAFQIGRASCRERVEVVLVGSS